MDLHLKRSTDAVDPRISRKVRKKSERGKRKRSHFRRTLRHRAGGASGEEGEEGWRVNWGAKARVKPLPREKSGWKGGSKKL